MVLRSGYAEDEAHEAIKLLLECEGRSVNWADIAESEEANNTDQQDSVVSKRSGPTVGSLVEARQFRRLHLGDLPDTPLSLLAAAAEHAVAEAIRKRNSLETRNLSPAQEEMLLEMKWALDALMQSYVISVIDNEAVFCNVTVFSIAKISSSLVSILARWDLWETLVCLQEFRLSVVPDWRTLKKSHGGVIDDTKISPLLACVPVYELLHRFVGQCPNITSLHFEWVCGGEPGHGIAQRNRYILPAPFAASAALMGTSVWLQPSERMLSLPHVQTLSLKNAWSMPHVFLSAIGKMALSALVHLELESFSLTGPPTALDQDRITARGTDIGHWPWPLCDGAVPGRMYNRALGPGWAALQQQQHQHAMAAALAAQALHQQQQVAAALNPAQQQHGGANALANTVVGVITLIPNPNHQGTALHASQPPWAGPVDGTDPVPRMFSWAHVLNELTPHQTIQDKYARAASDEAELAFSRLAEDTIRWVGRMTEAEKKKKRTLATVKFTSCGFELVDEVNIEIVVIIPDQPVMCHMVSDAIPRLREADKAMLIGQDVLLGRIVDHIDPSEKNKLHHIFGLDIPGLLTPFDSTMVDPGILEDGFTMYGSGRFHGVITRSAPAAPAT